MEQTLPSFKSPPLVETALSVQFQLIEKLRNAHLVLFWESIRTEFPEISDAQPLPEQVEMFDVPPRIQRLPSFRIANEGPAVRFQMASADDQTMVQVQNGRIIFNWRKTRGCEYPRWNTVFPRFKDILNEFRGMLTSEGFGPITPSQWEVVYVNHFFKGKDWNEPGDWPALVPGLVPDAMKFSTGSPESLACNVHLAMPEKAGRLHVDLFHGFTGADTKLQELLVLQITARGGIAENSPETLYNGLERGHKAIIRTFCDLTGSDAQAKWEREL